MDDLCLGLDGATFMGGPCLSPLLSAALPLSNLGSDNFADLKSDDWLLKFESDCDWGGDSAGNSSLSSPSSLPEDHPSCYDEHYDNIFPHSTNSFTDCKMDADTDIFGEPSLGGLSAGGSVFDTLTDDMVKKEVKTEPEVQEEVNRPLTTPLTKPKRRPTVSTRTAIMARNGRLNASRANGNSRGRRTNNTSSHAMPPSSISLFSDHNESQPASGCATGKDGKKNGVQTDAKNGSKSVHGLSVSAALPYLRKPVLVRRRLRECTMVCWLFRTLLTAEYRALPLNGIFEVFEDTFHNPSSAHGRHWRQSIRHCLMSSAVFVRVLTPNPRKDFLVMNEAGSWWTVHPDTEALCASEVFAMGAGHRCPPQQGMPYSFRLRVTRGDDTRQLYEKRGSAFLGERIYRTPPPLAARRIPPRPHPFRNNSSLWMAESSSSGDHLIIDHEEEVC